MSKCAHADWASRFTSSSARLPGAAGACPGQLQGDLVAHDGPGPAIPVR